MVAVDARLYVIGGRVGGTNQFQECIEMFSTTIGAWTLCRATLGCYMPGVLAWEGQIYIFPGQDTTIYIEEEERNLGIVYVYSPDSDSFVVNPGGSIFDNLEDFETRRRIGRYAVYGDACTLVFHNNHQKFLD